MTSEYCSREEADGLEGEVPHGVFYREHESNGRTAPLTNRPKPCPINSPIQDFVCVPSVAKVHTGHRKGYKDGDEGFHRVPHMAIKTITAFLLVTPPDT